jgi:LacI family transcriptional regulator
MNTNTIPNVAINRTPGFVAAFEHLWEKGHRKVAFLSNSQQISSSYTMKIFKSYFSDKKAFDDNLIFNVDNIYDLRDLLKSFNGNFPFTALQCLNDTMADFTVRELRYMGIEVPEDIAVIGMDGNPTYQAKNGSHISTVKLPWQELAAVGARTLIGMIEQEENILRATKLIDAVFIPGKTS